MSEAIDAYGALGLEPGASHDAIRAAYRRVVRVTHEDRLIGLGEVERAEALRRFQEAVQAYRILSDPRARRLYDRRFAPPHSLRELFFGPAGQRVCELLLPRAARAARRGEDLVVTVVPDRRPSPDGDVLVFEVATAFGPERIVVPAEPGRTWLRLSGYGAPGSSGSSGGAAGPPGDLLVCLVPSSRPSPRKP